MATLGDSPTRQNDPPVDFGIAPPMATADAAFTIPQAAANARLTARIAEDDSQGRFRILAFEGFAPNNPEKPADASDGTTPLKVAKGQRVVVRLRFHSLQPKERDRFTASLLIQDADNAAPARRVRLVAQVGWIATTVSSGARVTQGQRTTVAVRVSSNAGPDTEVSYTIRPNAGGVSMAPVTVAVARDAKVTVQLEFAAAADARLGRHDVMLESAAFDGRLVFPVPVPIDVRSPRADAAEQCQFRESAAASWARDRQVWSSFGIVDQPGTCLGFLPTPKLLKPMNQYELARAIRDAEAAGETVRALGSGWSFTDAVLPQPEAIRSGDLGQFRTQGLSTELGEPQLARDAAAFVNDFGHAIDTSALDRSLQVLLPQIVADNRSVDLLFFTEAGMTINFLNIYLDSQTPRLALPTMGGATAQTIAGAFSTGTHGSDFDRPPLADAVRAMYIVGQGGAHHWVEPADHLTDPAKLRAVFPCLLAEHIHYDDDLFRSALVSMGSMGVIYAVILDVVPQFSLMQFNRWSTWETFKSEAGGDFMNLFNGSWTGIDTHLQDRGIENPVRFAQVVINPIRENDGSHRCFVSNRAQLPLQGRAGVQPLTDYTQVPPGDIRSAIQNSPEYGHHEHIHFAAAQIGGDLGGENDPQLLQLRNLLAFCKARNYPWAVRSVINLVMERTFPLPGAPATPQIDVGFLVMAPGGTQRAFPTLGSTSIESAFSFHSSVPSPDQPGLRIVVPDAITFVDAVLDAFDAGVDSDDHILPAGWLSLRVTGRTSALLGMQRFDRSAMVEVSLIGTPDDYGVIARVEQITREQGGALHWGQSNGQMTFQDLEFAYSSFNLAKWRNAQRLLGGDTFTNYFMKRTGLIPTPLVSIQPTALRFGTVPVGDTSPPRSFRIANVGSGDLEVTVPASLTGAFRWTALNATITPGGHRDVEVEFSPQSQGLSTRAAAVQSNAPGSPHTVALSGTGRADRQPL